MATAPTPPPGPLPMVGGAVLETALDVRGLHGLEAQANIAKLGQIKALAGSPDYANNVQAIELLGAMTEEIRPKLEAQETFLYGQSGLGARDIEADLTRRATAGTRGSSTVPGITRAISGAEGETIAAGARTKIDTRVANIIKDFDNGVIDGAEAIRLSHSNPDVEARVRQKVEPRVNAEQRGDRAASLLTDPMTEIEFEDAVRDMPEVQALAPGIQEDYVRIIQSKFGPAARAHMVELDNLTRHEQTSHIQEQDMIRRRAEISFNMARMWRTVRTWGAAFAAAGLVMASGGAGVAVLLGGGAVAGGISTAALLGAGALGAEALYTQFLGTKNAQVVEQRRRKMLAAEKGIVQAQQILDNINTNEPQRRIQMARQVVGLMSDLYVESLPATVRANDADVKIIRELMLKGVGGSDAEKRIGALKNVDFSYQQAAQAPAAAPAA